MTTNERIEQFTNLGGPLANGFIDEALRYYSTEIITKQDEVRKDMKDGFINPEAWIDLAKAWQKIAK
jgi:hypothetical protein